MGQLTTISLCMIVKNEEIFLDTALKSVKSVLNISDVVVADTGSTDATKEIALSNGARVFDFKWCDDFSAARNFAADQAVNDWVLVLDADEEVMGVEIAELKSFINDAYAIGAITRVELSDKVNSNESRLYNRKYHRYEGRIHEQIVPVGSTRKIVKHTSVLVAHHGYLPEHMRVNDKLERNERLLRKELEEHPDDPYLLFQLGKSFYCNNRDLAQACGYFESALSTLPDFRLEYVFDMVTCYGYALINTGQYKKALELRDYYAKSYASHPQFLFLSAHIYQNNGMLIEAVEYYEKCILTKTVDYCGITTYLAHFNIGVILECVGMINEAVGMYIACGEYKPAQLRLAELGRQ